LVRRDQSAEIVAKRDVERRAIVQSADAHCAYVAGYFACLVRHTADKVGVKGTFLQNAGAVRRDAKQISNSIVIEDQEGVENGTNKLRPAFVWFVDARNIGRFDLLFF